jgi:hypothetical protein
MMLNQSCLNVTCSPELEEFSRSLAAVQVYYGVTYIRVFAEEQTNFRCVSRQIELHSNNLFSINGKGGPVTLGSWIRSRSFASYQLFRVNVVINL